MTIKLTKLERLTEGFSDQWYAWDDSGRKYYFKRRDDYLLINVDYAWSSMGDGYAIELDAANKPMSDNELREAVSSYFRFAKEIHPPQFPVENELDALGVLHDDMMEHKNEHPMIALLCLHLDRIYAGMLGR